jgi:hypothetical protein
MDPFRISTLARRKIEVKIKGSKVNLRRNLFKKQTTIGF